jgi:hypothetical protein
MRCRPRLFPPHNIFILGLKSMLKMTRVAKTKFGNADEDVPL